MDLSRRSFLGVAAATLLLPAFPREGSLLDAVISSTASAQPAARDSPDHVTDHTTPDERPAFLPGDIIAHTSRSAQSKFIQLATDSPYTHIGMVVQRKKGLYVIEAVEPVKYTPLRTWVQRGVVGKYTVKRLRQPLSSHDLEQVIGEAERHLGRHYDKLFKPSDTRMYCSELVAKAYERGAGVKLGDWKTVDDLLGERVGALQAIPVVKDEIKRRWGSYPDSMQVVTPKSIMDSPHLQLVYSTIEAMPR